MKPRHQARSRNHEVERGVLDFTQPSSLEAIPIASAPRQTLRLQSTQDEVFSSRPVDAPSATDIVERSNGWIRDRVREELAEQYNAEQVELLRNRVNDREKQLGRAKEEIEYLTQRIQERELPRPPVPEPSQSIFSSVLEPGLSRRSGSRLRSRTCAVIAGAFEFKNLITADPQETFFKIASERVEEDPQGISRMQRAIDTGLLARVAAQLSNKLEAKLSDLATAALVATTISDADAVAGFETGSSTDGDLDLIVMLSAVLAHAAETGRIKRDQAEELMEYIARVTGEDFSVSEDPGVILEGYPETHIEVLVSVFLSALKANELAVLSSSITHGVDPTDPDVVENPEADAAEEASRFQEVAQSAAELAESYEEKLRSFIVDVLWTAGYSLETETEIPDLEAQPGLARALRVVALWAVLVRGFWTSESLSDSENFINCVKSAAAACVYAELGKATEMLVSNGRVGLLAVGNQREWLECVYTYVVKNIIERSSDLTDERFQQDLASADTDTDDLSIRVLYLLGFVNPSEMIDYIHSVLESDALPTLVMTPGEQSFDASDKAWSFLAALDYTLDL